MRLELTDTNIKRTFLVCVSIYVMLSTIVQGERGGLVVECRTPEREVRGSKPTAAVLCP